jgi:sialate O-acetylesterase
MDGQVLQRDKRGLGGATISGLTRETGKVEMHLGKRRQVIGTAARGEFKAKVTGLKTGGPYRIELRIGNEKLVVRDVFVGDVWILGGQSNMQGVGNLCDAPKPHPLVRCFSMADEWGRAVEPLHFLEEAVDRFHNGYGAGPNRPPQSVLIRMSKARLKGVSPGLAFGREMVARTGVPQGLLACAHGGTSMTQWSPSLRDKGGDSLYGALLRRYAKLGQPVAGVLWYQGESDATPEAAPHYTDRMIELVSSVRRDLRLPGLPWVVVQIGLHAATDNVVSWNSIQEQQRHLPERIRNLDVAPVIDLQLDDGIHVGGLGQQLLGKRLARLADRLVNRNPKAKPGIVLDKVEVVPTLGGSIWLAAAALRLTYRNVAGRLVSQGLPTGFSLLNKHGHDVVGIFKTTVQGNQVMLHTNMMVMHLEQLSVSYGHGKSPYCNITDSEGMSLPVMQAVPVPVDTTRAPDCTRWDSAYLPSVKSVADVGLRQAIRAKGWSPAPPRQIFGVLPCAPDDKRTGVFAMRSTVSCTESLDALFMMAANAPFKAWVNGKLVFDDPAACAPIVPNKYKARLRLRRGKNQVVVAFTRPTATQWLGIFVRIGTPRGKLDPRIR